MLEQNDNYALYGKTGWATNPIGWFVGWIKTNGNIYSFAVNLNISNPKLLSKREEIVKDYFKNMNIIK